MIAQNLRQGHYQVLQKVLQKEFIKLNVDISIKRKNVKHLELHTNIASTLLNTQTLKMQSYTNVYVVTGIIEKSLKKIQRSDFLIHPNFVNAITINVFWCCKKGVYPYEYMDDTSWIWYIITWKRRFLQ